MSRRAAACPSCGAPREGTAPVFDLVLADGTRIPLSSAVSIGRASVNTVQLRDPSVSRHHARISPGPRVGDRPVVTDLGSRFGTWLDGRRLAKAEALHNGSRLALGDARLVVERRRSDREAGRTIVVPPGSSIVAPAVGGYARLESASTHVGTRPRLRSGYALKRLEEGEGTRRWVLRDLVGERYVRLTEDEAALLPFLDGRHTLDELVREAELRADGAGAGRVALLLAGLADRGLLADSGEPRAEPEPVSAGGVQGLLRPRERSWAGAGAWFERLYARGGWVLFTAPAMTAIALVAAIGIAAFAYLVAAAYGTPFVVASKVGVGGLVFLLGRFALVAAHETAHGLTMASFGRRVQRAGLKVLLVFPYAYVDTSEAWFEPRRRRIAVSAAGPVSDLALGGAFALACLALPTGTARDVTFQLAFAAYLGALFNLNPLLERDGYQMLADALRTPGLRRRALVQLRRKLAGGRSKADSRLLARYGAFAIAWLAVAAVFSVGLSLRYEARLASLVPEPVAWALLSVVWAALFVPVLALVVPPLRQRRRAREA
jgi:putative peptide zinc metalloprotease protein